MKGVRMAEGKPKLAIYWAASCGGCEVSVVNLHEKLLDVVAAFDFMFCPCLLDTKKKDIEALDDGEIAVTLFNGAIRTSENLEWARLLRRKSNILVAFGACAYGGGIPGLSNLHDRESHLRAIYLDNPSIDNPEGVLPTGKFSLPQGEVELPSFDAKVKRLADVVPVDYSVPGCPPESEQIWNVVAALDAPTPPARGSVVGAGKSSVCDECERSRTDKRIEKFRRVWEFVPDREECLLEQGIACMGVATRSGCGGLCPQVNMPCIGCYGPCEGTYDQSAKMISAIGSIIDIAPIKRLRNEEAVAAKVDETLDTLPDIAGVTAKFHNSGGLFGRR
jgi:F420-non-reducing hydrogenase small subunit